MKLISDIINELIDSGKSISSPLLKTKVLASKLSNSELLKWVNDELNGYSEDDELPSYRKVSASVVGTYFNGNLQFNDQPIPTVGLPEPFDKEIHTMRFNHSVATLESYMKNDSMGSLETTFTPEVSEIIARNIRKMGNSFFQAVYIKKVSPVNVIVQVLATIRSKLLDFMLILENEFNDISDISDLKAANDEMNKKVINIMKQTIIYSTGDGNLINTGNNAKIKAKIEVQKGDIEKLKQVLRENQVEENDINELETILLTEKVDTVQQKFGPKINQWIKNMLGKAVDGTWTIGAGVAGNFIYDVIKAYYGF